MTYILLPESTPTCHEEALAPHSAHRQDSATGFLLKPPSSLGPNLLHLSQPVGFDLLGSLGHLLASQHWRGRAPLPFE